jgi:transcriptional regulator with XRE-family HTH domain
MNRRVLTKEELADVDRLRACWERRKGELRLTQSKAAEALGFSNQTAISQYINGRIPLNMEAAFKFAELLEVPIDELSPRYSKRVSKPQGPVTRIQVRSVANLQIVEAKNNVLAPHVKAGELMVVDQSDLDGSGVSLPTGRVVAVFTTES